MLVMNLLDLPERLLYLLLQNYFSLSDWCALSIVCSRLRDAIQVCWLEKRHLIVDQDVFDLNPLTSPKFYIVEDNLWPQRLYKSECAVNAQAVRLAYKELWFLFQKCTRLQKITFCGNSSSFNIMSAEKRPLGGSVLRLFSQRSFYMVAVLDLSNTMFSLHDLEEAAPGFSNLSELKVDNCRIYISRPRACHNISSKVLQQYIVDYSKIKPRMCQGMRILLYSCRELFSELQTVHSGRAEFQSTGCIVYSFGREEANTVYKIAEMKLQWYERMTCCF